MKVLVTGAKGQLGWDVLRELDRRGIPCRGTDVEDFDLTDGPAVKNFVREYMPDVIVHCAGIYFYGLCVLRRGRGALDGGGSVSAEECVWPEQAAG